MDYQNNKRCFLEIDIFKDFEENIFRYYPTTILYLYGYFPRTVKLLTNFLRTIAFLKANFRKIRLTKIGISKSEYFFRELSVSEAGYLKIFFLNQKIYKNVQGHTITWIFLFIFFKQIYLLRVSFVGLSNHSL